MFLSSDGARQTTVTCRDLLGHVERRLPGRVGAADDDDVLAAVARRLTRRRAVADARADQPLDARRVEAPVVDAGGRERLHNERAEAL